MHQIDDAIVKGGQLVLSHLPFADGQHVRVVVAETDAIHWRSGRSIDEIRGVLKGAVERFDDSFEPLIPPEDWEMLK